MNNKKPHYDWIFLYWMPYDNNLSHFGQPILEMIAKGVQSSKLLVVVESDFWDDRPLYRSTISQGGIETESLRETNSASDVVFADYLNWAQSKFRANNWAIVVLGHGGGLDEVSPDEHPGNGLLGLQWMKIQKMSEVLADFNQKIDDKVELFFFQNCNKGTLEAHYTIHKVARYTLSSQKILGAPNFYYEPLFKFLGQTPALTGLEVAQKIEAFEGSNMYSSYTVTQNSNLGSIGSVLNAVIDSILNSNFIEFNLSSLSTYSYYNENYIDLLYFLTKLSEQSGVSTETLNRFVEFFDRAVTHLPNPEKNSSHESGLGLFLPESREQLDRYRDLPIYSETKLIQIFDTILFNV